MKLVADFCRRLKARAEALHLVAEDFPMLVSSSFRGRDEDALEATTELAGLRLGAYPVIVSPLSTKAESDVRRQVRLLHNQAIVARSYLTNAQVVDLHVFFVAEPDASDDEWRKYVDVIERDESVCRKLVWTRTTTVSQSFERFVQRTFLARPWDGETGETDVPLDQNVSLVQHVLESHGLSPSAASEWIAAASEPQHGGPAELVRRLISAMDRT